MDDSITFENIAYCLENNINPITGEKLNEDSAWLHPVILEDIKSRTNELKKIYSIGKVDYPSQKEYKVDLLKKHRNAYKKWNKEDDELLIKLHNAEISNKDIGKILGRQTSAIRSRLKKKNP